MRQRQKGQQFQTSELEAFLAAFGDDRNPLPETVKVLDEIITDFVIETCHEAAQVASYARRAKIKVDDFKFILRRDPRKLGRVAELLSMDREIKNRKKMFEIEEAQLAKGEKGEKGEKRKGEEGEKEAEERPAKKPKKAKSTV